MSFLSSFVCLALILLAVQRVLFRKKNFLLSHQLRQSQDELKLRREEGTLGEAKIQAILSSMFEGILLTNDKGEILVMNPSLRRIFQIQAHPEGKRPIEMIRHAPIQEIVDRILKGRIPFISEEISLTVPEERVMRVNAVPIEKEKGVEGAILVFHDITQLRHLEKIRQDFVANVSHELRTPICSIKGYVETLLDGAMNEPDRLREFLEIVNADTNRLAKLIDDLLDLARIESGKLKLALVPQEVGMIIRKCVSIVERQASSKKIVIKMSVENPLQKIAVDETQISQALLNLLDNAIKYSAQGGEIRVSALLKDKFIQVDVSDTGMGIPEKDLTRIFERFYRVDRARSRELGGTGLGLSIVKHIIQSHGGEIWVKSQPGQGSTFSFVIPIAAS